MEENAQRKAGGDWDMGRRAGGGDKGNGTVIDTRFFVSSRKNARPLW